MIINRKCSAGTVLLSFLLATVAIYLIFPHLNESITSWQGEVSGTILAGISFKARIANFYFLLCILFPLLFCLFTFLFSKFIKNISFKCVTTNMSDIVLSIQTYCFSTVFSALITYPALKMNDYHLVENAGLKSTMFDAIITNKNFHKSFIIWLFCFLIVLIVVRVLMRKTKYIMLKNKMHFILINLMGLFYVISIYLPKILPDGKYKTLLNLSYEHGAYLAVLIFFGYLLTTISLFKEKAFVNLNLARTIAMYVSAVIIIFQVSSKIDIACTVVPVLFVALNAIYCSGLSIKTLFRNTNVSNFCTLFLFFPIFYNLYFELVFVLRESNSFFVSFATMRVVFIITFSITALIVSACVTNQKIDLFRTNLMFYFSFISVLFFCYFTIKQNYIFDYRNYSNAFELGNNTVAYESLAYQKIPFMDYFSAHALYDVWTQLLYCIIHKNWIGLFASPYSGLNDILGYAALFLLLKKLFGIEYAYLLVLFFPFNLSGYKNVNFCMVCVYALFLLLEKYNCQRATLFWFLLLISAFYIYDVGISLGVAAILSFTLFLVVSKNTKDLLSFYAIGLCIGLIFISIIFLYCLINNIDILNKVMEWKTLTLDSYQSLSRASIGKYLSPQYFLSYFVFPSFAVLSIIFVLYKIIISKTANHNIYIVSLFAISQILFISRMVAFHNYEVTRGLTGVLFNYFPWTFALFFTYFLGYNNDTTAKLNRFLVTYIIVIAIISFGMTYSIPNSKSQLFTNSFTQVIRNKDIEKGDEYIQASFSNKSNEFYNQFKEIFDLLLEKNETFLDFANITSLYAYAKRNLPVYVAQSPGLLNGIESQKYFLRECNNHSLPLAIIGDVRKGYIQNIYDVNHNVRYYIIAEYIYKNYRPLVKISDFSIWCLKDKYADYSEVLKTLNAQHSFIDYGYDLDSTAFPYNHSYDIQYLPYVSGTFGNYNENNLIDRPILNNNIFKFGFKRHSVASTIYLVVDINNLDNKSMVSTATLYQDGDSDYKISYKFKIYPGKHKYLFQVSSDYLFTCNDKINTLKFDDVDIGNISRVIFITDKEDK